MIVDYIAYTLLLFFITFFMGVFVQYFRTKTITPAKMFTYKKGGVFEHYFIVGGIMAVIILVHVIFGLNPFRGDNVYADLIGLTPIILVGFVFLVFLFVFLLYFMTSIYLKIRSQIDRKTYYEKYTDLIIKASFGLALFFTLVFIIAFVIGYRGL